MHYTSTHQALSPSTNSELINAIKTGQLPATSPHRLTASRQTHGRGQHNRTWLSPYGNVYLSFFVPMVSTSVKEGLACLSGTLSLLVGFYLYQMPIIQTLNDKLRQCHQSPICLKWANDLGFYDLNCTQGAIAMFHKLAGILIEPIYQHSQLLGVVIGVGLNVSQAPIIKDGLYRAVSLFELCQSIKTLTITKETMPDALCDDFDATKLYAPMTDAIISAIMHHNHLSHIKNKPIELDKAFIDAFNQAHALTGKFTGIFEQDNQAMPSHFGECLGIASDGTLILDTKTGRQHIATGMAKWLLQDPKDIV